MRFKTWVGYLLFSMLSCGLRAESGLNGVAVYSELGNELFIAALYSEQTGTNAQELINGSYPKRIELKVLSRAGVTERQFNRLWRESIAINNDQNLLTAQAENMVYFEALFRDRLETNDHVVIDFVPARGVSISLNTVELGHIEDDAFFGLLLRSWIGLVPSSTQFRDNLLSVTLVDAALVNRYTQMYPRNARINAVKQWRQASQPEMADETAIESTPVVIPVVNPVPATVATKDAAKLASTPKSSSPKPLPVAAPVAIVKNDSSSLAVSSARSMDTNKSEPDIQQASAVIDTQAQQNTLRAQVLLAKQFYMADVFKKIYSQVSYPKRAQELQQTGTVRVTVVIDALGKLKSVIPGEASPFMLLNKAALAAVKRAAPFAPLPSGFDVTEMEFSVPITFSLQGF